MTKLTGLVAALACACLPLAAAAQDPPAAENRNPITRLDNITSLNCTFPVSTVATFAKDGSTPTARLRPVGGPVLTVRVENMDASGGLGDFTAPQKTEAAVQQYGWNMHVMDASRSGRMMLLTVFGRESTAGKLKAVFTRTDYLPVDLPGFITEPDSSQYYGECEVTR